MIEKLIKILVVLLSVFALASCDEDDTKKGKVEPVPNDPNDYTYDWRELPPFDKIFKSESYGDGDVVTFDWTQTLAWFLKSDDYKYGFDMDPYAIFDDGEAPLRGSDVYVSVKRNELANVKIRIDPKTKKMYHLHKVDENGEIVEEDVVSAKDICLKEDCIDEVSLPAGDYAVYYDDMDVERYLHIIPYTLDPPREIIYVQFGDDDAPGCIKDGKNGCYTKKKVEEKFNEIMRQAVVEGRFIEKKPSDIGLDDYFTVELSEPNPSQKILNRIDATEMYGYLNEYDDYVANFGLTTEIYAKETLNTKYNRIKKNKIILAINQMRVNWHFTKEVSKVFNNYLALKQVLEKSGEESLLMKLKSSCRGGEKDFRLKGKNPKEDGTFTPVGLPALEDGCEYDAYADVAPFIPEQPKGAQVTYCYSEELPICKKEESEDDCSARIKSMPRPGGVVWGSHVSGDASLNTLIHEIGHSFGLTDLYIAKDDPTFAPNYYRYFAVDENNLMSWSLPTGMRLRYRPLLTAVTLDGSLIPDPKGGFAVERQWDCIRSYKKCSTLR